MLSFSFDRLRMTEERRKPFSPAVFICGFKIIV